MNMRDRNEPEDGFRVCRIEHRGRPSGTIRRFLVVAVLAGFLASTMAAYFASEHAVELAGSSEPGAAPRNTATATDAGTQLLAEASDSIHGLAVPNSHSPSWKQLNPASSPTARQAASMAYDPKDGYVVLFGGSSGSFGILGDTWIFKGGNWTQLTLSKSPSARFGASLTYDAHDGYLLLFGGDTSTTSGAAVNDTWKFIHGSWTQLSPPVSPPARFWAGMTYDARDRYVVLFGGQGCTSATVCSYLNDTWDYVSGVWINVTRSVAPSPRAVPNMVFDAADNYVMLFGGNIAGANNTWKFVNGIWTNITPLVSPNDQGGAYASMSYDPAQGFVVLFGGNPLRCTGCGSPVPAVNFTWKFVGGSWTNITSVHSPPARAEANLVFVGNTKGHLLLFGGALYGYFGYSIVPFSDSWEYP